MRFAFAVTIVDHLLCNASHSIDFFGRKSREFFIGSSSKKRIRYKIGNDLARKLLIYIKVMEKETQRYREIYK